MNKTTMIATMVTLALTGGAMAQANGPANVAETSKGKVLADAKGKPLYTFAKDEKPSETKGDGLLNGAWHIATP